MLLPPDEIVRLWKAHVNDGIWCANRYAKDLMELRLEPPLPGNVALNPWSEFNLAGQFVGESFGLMAPAMPDDKGAMFVRRSTDLHDWSDSSSVKVLSGGSPGSLWNHAECPHVIHHGGYYYLFRTSNYKGDPITTVYRSADPTEFGIDDDSKIVATLPVAAPGIINRDGQYWIAALNPQLDGIRVTRLRFVPEPQP